MHRRPYAAAGLILMFILIITRNLLQPWYRLVGKFDVITTNNTQRREIHTIRREIDLYHGLFS